MSTGEYGIAKVWLTNNVSATLIIPANIAKKHKLTKGTRVIISDSDKGILIKRLDL